MDKSLIQEKTKLLYVMTYGVSGAIWQSSGTLKRETMPLKYLCENLKFDLTILTFGNPKEEVQIFNRVSKNIEVVCCPIEASKRFSILNFLKSCHAAYRLGKKRDFDSILTNQLNGGWIHLLLKSAGRRITPKLILRSGFDPYFHAVTKGNKLFQLFFYFNNLFAFKSADSVVFTTEFLKKFAFEQYAFLGSKPAYVLRNWIDTSSFYSSDDNVDRSNDLIVVARFVAEKRLDRAIRFAELTGLSLTIVGDGPEKQKIFERSQNSTANVNFKGRVKAQDLGKLLRSHKFYLSFSEVEGSPKSLIEAIACGCRCVISDNHELKEEFNSCGSVIWLPSDQTLEQQASWWIDLVTENRLKSIDKAAVSEFIERYSPITYAEKIADIICRSNEGSNESFCDPDGQSR